MILDKAKMAHEWAMKHGKVDSIYNREETVQLAWGYADAMQAEADKREPKGFPEVLQPELDWRLAPEWALKWVMVDGRSDWVSGDNSEWNNAPSFGLTGNHVVERPQ